MNQNKIRLLLAILVVFTIMIISKYYLHVSATNEEIITKGMIFNNDSDYVYSDYVYSYEEYQKMYEEYGKAIKSEHDQAPDDTHIYFAGMDILSKHAIWTSKVPQRLLKATTTSITIKNGGTWQANGYYGVIMKDDDGKYYYCASHGLDVPVGKYSYNESQSDKIMKALSWAYPNVNTNASQSVDYGKSQMAVWTALGQFNISKTTIGSTYYKIVDAYKGNIATNNKTFSINKGTNSEIIQDINMSTYLHFSGTAGWHISQSQLDYAKAHNFAYYVYQVSSKKYVKLTWTSFSSPANYSYLRIGTTDMNTNLNISNINIITQQAQRVGFLYNSSNNAYQNLWNTIEQEPQTIYTANLSITNKTGSVSLVKKANGIDLYEQSIIDSNNNLYYASKDGKQVIYEDGVNIAQILKYPNKQEMTSNNLFNKPITYQYIDYDNVMVDDITKAIVDEKGNEPTINDGTGNMITNLAWTPTYEKKQAIDENGIPIVKAKLAENNEPIMATRTLPLNYPSQTQMDNIYNLKGVEFTLTGTVNGKAVKQVKTTDANGQIIWTGLLPATYTITETKTNENFILISNKYSAKVTTGNTTKVNNGNAIMNDEANGSLIINKTDIKGQPIKDVIFDIYEANADGSANLDKYVDSVQTDEEGKATWTSNEGNYVAIEKVAPESYVNEEQAQNFSLKRKEVALLDYMNKIKYDEVLVKKRDVGDKELAGATLCIMSNDKSPLQIKEKNEFKDTTYDKGVMCWQSETKDKEFSVPIGEYTMYEEMAPQGYEKTSQTFPFSVVGNGEVHDIKIVNQPIKYDDIHVSKVDLNDNELVGATLCIMTKDNSPLEIKEKNDNSTKIFEDGKMCWLSSNHPKEFKLRMGNYYLYEQVAPFGYQKTSQLFNFNVIGKNKVQKFKIINSPIKLPKTGK